MMIEEKKLPPIEEWKAYLLRTKLTIEEGAKHELYREVGRFYGCTEEEMNSVLKKSN